MITRADRYARWLDGRRAARLRPRPPAVPALYQPGRRRAVIPLEKSTGTAGHAHRAGRRPERTLQIHHIKLAV